jgi:hypothetical protein
MINRMNIQPQSINTVNRILDMERYNGRVNLLEPEDPDVKFRMFEKIAIKNKATPYREALNGQWEVNVLSQAFFSAENIQIIQNGIRAGVYRLSDGKMNVPPQNIDQIKIVMRSIYLQYARHKKENITEQIENMNNLVLEYCVPFVYNEAKSYIKYLQDQSTLVVPLEREVRSDRVYHQLELKPWF